jgi:hypothetical protein
VFRFLGEWSSPEVAPARLEVDLASRASEHTLVIEFGLRLKADLSGDNAALPALVVDRVRGPVIEREDVQRSV